MPTCALRDADVADDEPDDVLVTSPVIRRSVPWDGPLPAIPPLHEHIEYAAFAIDRRRTRHGGCAPAGALVPGSVAHRLLSFMRENYPPPTSVDGPALRAAFSLGEPHVGDKTYIGALARLVSLRFVVSARVVGTNRCTYRLVHA